MNWHFNRRYKTIISFGSYKYECQVWCHQLNMDLLVAGVYEDETIYVSYVKR